MKYCLLLGLLFIVIVTILLYLYCKDKNIKNVVLYGFLGLFNIVMIALVYFKCHKKNSFEKINKEIDDEHEQIEKQIETILNMCDTNFNKNDMIDNIQKMYNISESHWKTEDEYFVFAVKNAPENHLDLMNTCMEEHKKAHETTLNFIGSIRDKVIDMEGQEEIRKYVKASVMDLNKKILNHINTLDVRDFKHWVKFMNISTLH